jgi:hypothetical protein
VSKANRQSNLADEKQRLIGKLHLVIQALEIATAEARLFDIDDEFIAAFHSIASMLRETTRCLTDQRCVRPCIREVGAS